jgi:branched-chain amino acid transport system ATP-binding protein
MSELLRIDGLDVGYGDFQALFGINLSVGEAETVSMIGANGAGKSTLLKAIVGLVAPMRGDILFDGRSISSLAAHRRVADGIALVPEGRRIFASLTVEENIVIGGDVGRPGPWNMKAVLEAFPLLSRLLKRSGEGLSGGERQTLAIARALMSNPRLLLFDEVSLGLAPIVVRQVYEAIPVIKEQGTTVLVIEQDVNQALAVADRFYCLLEGRIALSGVPGEVSKEQITEAYFGMSTARGER